MPPPHAKTPPTSSDTLFSFSASMRTSQKTSTKSEVPHALLMARDESLGIMIPAAATMETTMGVILFPGMPPRLWKSNTGSLSNLMISPVSAMATVKSAISSMSISLMYRAVSQAEISILDSLFSRISSTMARISSLSSFSPSIFLRMESGLGAYWTFTTSPSSTPHLSMRLRCIRTAPFSTSVSDLLTRATMVLLPVMLTRSFSLTPISKQSSS